MSVMPGGMERSFTRQGGRATELARGEVQLYHKATQQAREVLKEERERKEKMKQHKKQGSQQKQQRQQLELCSSPELHSGEQLAAVLGG